MGRHKKTVAVEAENANTSTNGGAVLTVSEMLKAEAKANAEKELARIRAEREAKEAAEREEREREAKEEAERKEREAREAKEAERKAAEMKERERAEKEAAKKARIEKAEQDYVILKTANDALEKLKTRGYMRLFEMPLRDGHEFFANLRYYLGEARRICVNS